MRDRKKLSVEHQTPSCYNVKLPTMPNKRGSIKFQCENSTGVSGEHVDSMSLIILQTRWVHYTEGGWFSFACRKSNYSPGPGTQKICRLCSRSQSFARSCTSQERTLHSKSGTKSFNVLQTLMMVAISKNSLSWLNNAKWLVSSWVITVTLGCCKQVANYAATCKWTDRTVNGGPLGDLCRALLNKNNKKKHFDRRHDWFNRHNFYSWKSCFSFRFRQEKKNAGTGRVLSWGGSGMIVLQAGFTTCPWWEWTLKALRVFVWMFVWMWLWKRNHHMMPLSGLSRSFIDKKVDDPQLATDKWTDAWTVCVLWWTGDPCGCRQTPVFLIITDCFVCFTVYMFHLFVTSNCRCTTGFHRYSLFLVMKL